MCKAVVETPGDAETKVERSDPTKAEVTSVKKTLSLLDQMLGTEEETAAAKAANLPPKASLFASSLAVPGCMVLFKI